MSARGKIRKYIADYKFNSLFFRNMRLLLLLLVIPLAGATFLTYYAYSNMRKNEMKAYNEQVNADAYGDLERILKEAQTELTYIGFNSNVELYMYDTADIKQLNYSISGIQELIRLPVISKDYIRSIYLYSFKSDKVISLAGLSDFSTFSQKSCFEDYLAADGYRKVLITCGSDYGYEEKQLSVFQPIQYGKNQSGIAVMNIDLEALKKELSVSEHELVFMTDKEKILYSSNLEWIGRAASEIPGIENMIPNGTFLNSGYSISNRIADKEPLEVITYLGMEKYHSQLSTIKGAMVLFLCGILIITLVFSAFISVRIFRPIEEIMLAIQTNRSILVGEEALFEEKDELEYILYSIYRTANVKKDVDEELAERVRLLKKAQAVALQSQINPHFINNTLDTINWMAIGLLGGKNEISEMTGALSKMLRISLESTDSIIPLSQEIEHCKSYLEIQKIRYEDKFQVIWSLPEDLYACRTIRVILQPVIENAIYHGIKHLSCQGVIRIGGETDGSQVELTVTDNGLGMTEEELGRLRQEMDSKIIKESSHIGLTNVNQRIKLYFGEEYGISLECREGTGTIVYIRFPQIIDGAAQERS